MNTKNIIKQIKELDKKTDEYDDICYSINHQIQEKKELINYINTDGRKYYNNPDKEILNLGKEIEKLQNQKLDKNLEIMKQETKIIDEYIKILTQTKNAQEATYLKKIRLNITARTPVIITLLDKFAGIDI